MAELSSSGHGWGTGTPATAGNSWISAGTAAVRLGMLWDCGVGIAVGLWSGNALGL